jgi:hypothetical protein
MDLSFFSYAGICYFYPNKNTHMRSSIIFVLATFGGILALGLTVNAVKKARSTSSCWVQTEQGMVETQCPILTSPSNSEGEGLTGDIHSLSFPE